MLIFRELEDRGITMPAEIGAALGMLPVEATKLLRGHQWRELVIAAGILLMLHHLTAS